MWTFKQSTGDLSHNGVHVASGYAGGAQGKSPEGVNNPAMQSQHDIGPLPQGAYTIGAPSTHANLGPYAMQLTPAPTNTMFGRSGFFIHGDKVGKEGKRMASDGCMIFGPDIRAKIWTSNDHTLTVVA